MWNPDLILVSMIYILFAWVCVGISRGYRYGRHGQPPRVASWRGQHAKNKPKNPKTVSLICTSLQCYHVLWVEAGALILVCELGRLLAGKVSHSEEKGDDGEEARADWEGEREVIYYHFYAKISRLMRFFLSWVNLLNRWLSAYTVPADSGQTTGLPLG